MLSKFYDVITSDVSPAEVKAYMISLGIYDRFIHVHTNRLAYIRVDDLARLFGVTFSKLMEVIQANMQYYASNAAYVTTGGLFSVYSSGNPQDFALNQAGFEGLAHHMGWNTQNSRAYNDIISAMKLKAYNHYSEFKPKWLRSTIYDSTQLYRTIKMSLASSIASMQSVQIQGVSKELSFGTNKIQVELFNRLGDVVCGDLIQQVHLGGTIVSIEGRAELWFKGMEEGSRHSQWVKFRVRTDVYRLSFDGVNYSLEVDADRIVWG